MYPFVSGFLPQLLLLGEISSMFLLCLAVIHPILLRNILLCEYITHHCLLIDMWVVSSLVLLHKVPSKHTCSCFQHTWHISIAHIPEGVTAGYREVYLFQLQLIMSHCFQHGIAIFTTSCVQGFQGFATNQELPIIGILSFRYLHLWSVLVWSSGH